ncbi:CoxG family protein [Lacisediminimonas sp.]|uniref:CoxG family protein n=1 Tax=Lacisediminimonas sp. TaxID=3060582 RepID=UPI00271D89C1|nr:SRPBCC domain-containing protein [Lacisediminimonas sp.]MDO8299715.1 SRPBCC domain-containing protein [Lacisediminimonas sp.]MDO9216062.1 SRPBCC domain-containing protein [Lacisediminimonas sp.]
MNFTINADLPATPERLWVLFFDVQRVAALIPGCENVREITPLESYAAVMKQKIGPFKLEMPTDIKVEEHTAPSRVRMRASGRDKFTGTTLEVLLTVGLAALPDGGARLAVDADMQVNGRLASLGYSVVKKKSEELFIEFERRLRAELETV